MSKQTKDLVEHIFGTMIYSHYQRQFNELVDLVREAERNECAEICSDLFMSDGRWCAKAIKEKGKHG